LLLNDPTYVEAARALALRVLRNGGADDASRLGYTYRQALARDITPVESAVLQQLLVKHREHYRSHAPQAAELDGTGLARAPEGTDLVELAAWTNVARTVLNLHETITRN